MKQLLMKIKNNNNNFFSKTLAVVNTASQVLFYSLIFSNLTLLPYAQANPSGGNIVGGVGHIHNSALNTVIHQNSSSLAIDGRHLLVVSRSSFISR